MVRVHPFLRGPRGGFDTAREYRFVGTWRPRRSIYLKAAVENKKKAKELWKNKQEFLLHFATTIPIIVVIIVVVVVKWSRPFILADLLPFRLYTNHVFIKWTIPTPSLNTHSEWRWDKLNDEGIYYFLRVLDKKRIIKWGYAVNWAVSRWAKGNAAVCAVWVGDWMVLVKS